MYDWRIRKCYGHGAARVVLCTEAYDQPSQDPSLLEGWAAIAPQFSEAARAGAVLGTAILVALLSILLRNRPELSLTQLAFWHDPAPSSVEKQPPLAVLSVAVPAPKPPSPVIAKADITLEPELERVPKGDPEPKARPRPKPAAEARKPKIEMAALHSRVLPEVVRPTRTRVKVKQLARRVPIATPSLAMTAPAAVLLSESRSLRTRPAFKRIQGSTRRAPGITPVANAPQLAPAPDPSSTHPRRILVATSASATRHASIGIDEAPAALAPADSNFHWEALPTSRRSAKPKSATGSASSFPNKKFLRRVALGSLASCLRDRQEDLLKQRVLAAVRNRKSCVSSKGTYRFVESKNLNAFSMWIEHAPGRRASDRCDELSDALSCLE